MEHEKLAPDLLAAPAPPHIVDIALRLQTLETDFAALREAVQTRYHNALKRLHEQLSGVGVKPLDLDNDK